MAAIEPSTSEPRLLLDVLETISTGDYAFVDGRDRVSEVPYASLRERVGRVAAALARQGIRPGDRVGLMSSDKRELLLTFLGVVAAGAIPVPVAEAHLMADLDAHLASCAAILRRAGARALVASRGLVPVVWSLRAEVEGARVLDGGALLEDDAGDRWVEAEADAPCFLQFTSGSTAAPKGVVVTHRSLAANAVGIMRHGLEVREGDRALAWLPLFHDMGLIGFGLAPLWAALPVVLLPTISFLKRPHSWMAAMSRFEATITFAPNFAYGLAARRARVEGLDLSRVRVAGCGAEPIAAATLEAFCRAYAPAGFRAEAMMPCYGLAETTLAATFAPRLRPLEVLHAEAEALEVSGEVRPTSATAGARGCVSCGVPFPGHEVRVIDADGRRLDEDQVGEVVVRGPSVAGGYWDDPDASRDVFVDDGLRTGDLGFLHQGELYLLGREKELVILHGRNHHPHVFELEAAEIDGVRRGNVVAFSRLGPGGDELVIVAELSGRPDRDPVERAEVERALRARIKRRTGAVVKDVYLVDEGTLPKTTSGKLKRAEVKRACGGATPRFAHPRRGPVSLGRAAIGVGRHVARGVVGRLGHLIEAREEARE